MNNRIKLALISLVLFLSGCGKSVPQDKLSYVGEWEGPSMHLSLTREGSVSYKRVEGNTSKEVKAPLKGFNGNDFEAGIGPASTTFAVSKPPYQDGGQWKMVVDGVELVRTGGGAASM